MENNIEVFDEMYYGNGAFEFVEDNIIKDFLKSAHKAISLCELWDWLRIYEPPSNKGFMWSEIPELNKINYQLSKDSVNKLHSGSSYASIMRQMEYIAKNGYEKFKKEFLIFHK